MARKKETQIETDINNCESKPKTKRGSKASAKAAGRKRGRPKKITDEAIMKDADVYLQECQQRFLKADNQLMLMESIPQVVVFANRQNLTRQALYVRADKNPELFDTIKKITEAKEVMLEKGALVGVFNSSMAIFSLKQVGWKDKIETENELKSEITISFGDEMDEDSY